MDEDAVVSGADPSSGLMELSEEDLELVVGGLARTRQVPSQPSSEDVPTPLG